MVPRQYLAIDLKSFYASTECFDNFDYDRIAEYTDADVERILNTEGMIKSPRKVLV